MGNEVELKSLKACTISIDARLHRADKLSCSSTQRRMIAELRPLADRFKAEVAERGSDHAWLEEVAMFLAWGIIDSGRHEEMLRAVEKAWGGDKSTYCDARERARPGYQGEAQEGPGSVSRVTE